MSSILAKAIPSGGAITLNIASTDNMTLSRAVSGVGGLGTFVPLYAGGMVPFYVDIGDQLPGPLDPATLYVYQVSDDNGIIQSQPISPGTNLNVQIEPLTMILQRIMQGAMASLTLPDGIERPTVVIAMPIAGIPALPLITINLGLLQQREIPIGQSAWIYDNNGNATITGFAEWSFQVSILSKNAPERDFFRDTIIGVFLSFVSTILAPLGKDITHSFQIASGSVAKDSAGMAPGFYYADCTLDFSGTLNVTVTTTYGIIQTIDFKAYSPSEVVTEVIITELSP